MKISSVVAVSLLVAAGCESSAPPSDKPNPVTAAAPTAYSVYPAFTPDVPQVTNQGGSVLTAPKVVSVTWANEELLTDIETYGSTVGASSYWHQATSEYGVGPITSGGTVHVTDAPFGKTSDAAIQSWLQGRLDGTHPEWPAADGTTIYALYFPASTTVSDTSGTSCTEYLGYHSSTAVLATGVPIMYAVLPRCGTFDNLTPLQLLTTTASHELIEASTDPQPLDSPAFLTVDDDHFIWARIVGGGEVSDMCAQNPNANFKPDDFPYYVQRSWSNAAALAGADPCVPAPSQPYFGATPIDAPGPLTLTFGGGFSQDTEGYALTVGSSRTIDVGLYSSDATGTFQVEAKELNQMGATPTLSFTMDKTEGVNGDHIKVTMKALGVSTSHAGISPFAIVSSQGNAEHVWFGIAQTSTP